MLYKINTDFVNERTKYDKGSQYHTADRGQGNSSTASKIRPSLTAQDSSVHPEIATKKHTLKIAGKQAAESTQRSLERFKKLHLLRRTLYFAKQYIRISNRFEKDTPTRSRKHTFNQSVKTPPYPSKPPQSAKSD